LLAVQDFSQRSALVTNAIARFVSDAAAELLEMNHGCLNTAGRSKEQEAVQAA
jgi:hypothetical protein